MNLSDQVLLLTPGPTPIHPRALAAMQWPMRGHMDPDVFAFNDRVVADLHALYGSGPGAFAALLSGTGSLGMEAGLANLLEAGERLLVASNGVFGERTIEMAERMGVEVTPVRFALGEPVEPDEVLRVARKVRPKVLAVVHGETSTGVLNPLQELGEVAREVGALLSVDAVTTVGMMPFSMDAWGVDYAYTGSQKCLSAPPGLAPVVFGAAALEAIRARTTPVATWYADVLGMMRYWLPNDVGRAYHHTVPVQLHWATGEAIRAALDEGLAERARRVDALGRAILTARSGFGFAAFAPEPCRLPSVLALTLPDDLDDVRVRHRLRFDHHISVAGGLGPTEGRIWRLGLMGENARTEHYRRLMAALEAVQGYRGLVDRFDEALIPA
jgi:alanine-glyoxylate transaminase/serine-glyoxylate transaminase/serine-pyruvate transaminase